jgi:Tfp pilus assembly protein PilF
VGTLVLVAIAYGLLAGLRTVTDFDMGWQLATGRYVVQHHQIPSTDVLSYTTAGSEWLYPPSCGVLLYAIYSVLGYAGLSWFCAFACMAVVLVLLLPRPGILNAILIVLAIPAIAYRTGPRADLFSTLFFALFLGTLWAFQKGERVRLWLLPLTMFLWVNLHPGFVAGLGVIAVYLALEGWDLLFADRRPLALSRLRKALPWLAGSILVTLINPWGPRIYVAAMTLVGLRQTTATPVQTGAYVGELSGIPLSWRSVVQAVDLRNPDSGYWWMVLLAGMIAVRALASRRAAAESSAEGEKLTAFNWRPDAVPALLLVGAAYFSLQHMRYQALFAITTVTVGSWLGGLALQHCDDRRLAKGWCSSALQTLQRWVRARAVLILVTMGTILLAGARVADLLSNRYYVVSSSTSLFGPGESWWFPERAATFIKRVRLPGNVFEDYTMGGFAAWRLGPHYPDFIDGRGISPALLAEQRELMGTPPDSTSWQAAADRWNINVLLFSVARFGGLGSFDLDSFCRSGAWSPVYMDEVSIVFLRNRAENQLWLDSLGDECSKHEFVPPPSLSRAQEFNFDANAGAVLYVLGRSHEALSFLEQAESIFPFDPGVHLTLAQLLQQEGRVAEAEQEYLAALERKESDAAWYALGRLYAAEKRYPEAEVAIRNSAALVVHPYNNYKALGQVQLHLLKPQTALAEFARAEKDSPFDNLPAGYEFNAQIAEGRAEAWRQLGHLPEAIEFQQSALERTPDNPRRWEKLAELYQAAGQSQLAEEARRRASGLENGRGSPGASPVRQ